MRVITKPGTRNVIVPSYMTEFSCIGPACEENCCEINWLISVDKNTYTKYRKLKDPELRLDLDRLVKRNRRNPSDSHYANLKFEKGELSCFFLTEQKWCRIHQKHGIDFLCNTCALYPRQWNIIDGQYEMGASLSCPEVARQVMLRPDGIQFEAIEEEKDARRAVKTTIDTLELAKKNMPERYLLELRGFCMEVLKNRDYSIEDRLVILGVFCKKLDDLTEAQEVSSIPSKIASFRVMLADGSMKEMVAQIPVQLHVQTQLIKEIADYRFKYGFVKNKVTGSVYLKHLNEALVGMGYVEESTFEDVPERYRKGSEEYYKPFMQEYGYMLENYLVNFAFLHLFPYRKKKTFLDSFNTMVILFALIKMLMIGCGAYHKGLNPELLVSMVYSFITVTENNQFFLNDVHKSLKASGYNSLSAMCILAKN